MNDNGTNETFVRTALPLNMFTVKLGDGPAPWDVLTADKAREIALNAWFYGLDDTVITLSAYADAIDAMSRSGRVMATTEKEVARLRDELDTARDLLRSVPVPDYRSEYAEWQASVEDYLETI